MIQEDGLPTCVHRLAALTSLPGGFRGAIGAILKAPAYAGKTIRSPLYWNGLNWWLIQETYQWNVQCSSIRLGHRLPRRSRQAVDCAAAVRSLRQYFAGMISHYWWEGKIERAEEVVMIIKSRVSMVEPLRETVKQLHSYTTPAFMVLPVEHVDPEYHAWIVRETSQ